MMERKIPPPAFVFRASDGRVHLVRSRLRGATLSRRIEMIDATSNPAILGVDAPMDYARRYAAGVVDAHLMLELGDWRAAWLLGQQIGVDTPFALCVPHVAQYAGVARILATRADYAMARCSEIVVRSSRLALAEGPSSSSPVVRRSFRARETDGQQ